VKQKKMGRAIGGRWVGAAVAALVFSQGSFAAQKSADGERLLRSLTLHYVGAALENPAEVQKLYVRLRVAAQQVCRVPGDEVGNGRAAAACERAAVGRAVTNVNSEQLTALHVARNPRIPVVSAQRLATVPCQQCG
jgi:UrcA family protein